jgi:hypothetical protein
MWATLWNFQVIAQSKHSPFGRKSGHPEGWQQALASRVYAGLQQLYKRSKHLSVLCMYGRPGWPDVANFRLLGDCLLGAVFWKLQKYRSWTTFFHGINNVLILANNWLGDFFKNSSVHPDGSDIGEANFDKGSFFCVERLGSAWIRVTRLGEFSPIGQVFTRTAFLKIGEEAQAFGLLSSHGQSPCTKFWQKNRFCYILGVFHNFIWSPWPWTLNGGLWSVIVVVVDASISSFFSENSFFLPA